MNSPSFEKWTRPAPVMVVFSLLCVAVVVAMHLLNIDVWRQEINRVAGEYIMGTHDAYLWLAGAEGFGSSTGALLAWLARTMHSLTGMPIGLVGFWTPPFAASLVGVVLVVWAWSLGAREVGLVAGLLAALAPGFFFRTRLGYYDTDIVTLLMPLLFCLLLSVWIKPWLSPHPWLTLFHRLRLSKFVRLAKLPKDALVEGRPGFWLPVAAGLLGAISGEWHNSIQVYAKLAMVLAAVLALGMCREKERPTLLWGVLLGTLVLVAGWLGLVPALAVAAAQQWRPSLLEPWRDKFWIAAGALLLVLIGSGIFVKVYDQTIWFIKAYVKTAASSETANATREMVYPGITQSVIEAQDVPLREVLAQMHPWVFVAGLGMAGFIVLLVLRPQCLFLLPLAVFALMAFKFGARTCMFGGPAMALGLTAPIALALRVAKARTLWTYVLFLVLAVFLVLPYGLMYKRVAPTPVLSREHCQGLIDFQAKAEDNALAWTWWDWGYATNYYSQCRSYADGANHDDAVIFTLGQVMASDSLRKANQLMKYLSMRDNDPRKAFEGMSSDEVMAFLDKMGKEDMGFEAKEPLYMVVTADDLKLLAWIAYYGTWDPNRESGTHAKIMRLSGEIRLDLKDGSLRFSGQQTNVKRVVQLKEGVARTKEYARPRGPHLIIKDRDYLLMDDLGANSLIVRLLAAHPDDPEVRDYFELVLEGAPDIRIYRVR